MRTRCGVGAAAVVLAMLAGVAPATAVAAPRPALDGHVDVLDLDDLVDDLLYVLGLRDHGSNETSLLDVLGLTDENGGDPDPDPAPTPPAPPAAPAPQDVMAILHPPSGEDPEGPGELMALITPTEPGETPDLMAIVPPAQPPGEDAPGTDVTPGDLATVPEISGLEVPALPPSS